MTQQTAEITHFSTIFGEEVKMTLVPNPHHVTRLEYIEHTYGSARWSSRAPVSLISIDTLESYLSKKVNGWVALIECENETIVNLAGRYVAYTRTRQEAIELLEAMLAGAKLIAPPKTPPPLPESLKRISLREFAQDDE